MKHQHSLLSRLFVMLLACAILCSNLSISALAEEDAATEEAAEDAAEEAAEDPAGEEAEDDAGGDLDYTTGTPWIDSELDGNITEDTPVSLKDDFMVYVNKEAILATEIPEGRSYGGTVMDVALKQAEDIKNMFLGDEPESHDAKLAYCLYRLFMDWDARNELGVAPLKEMTDRLEGLSSIGELTAYFLETPAEEQLAELWYAGSLEDLGDSTRYILTADSPALLLEDSAEYSTLTELGAIKKEAKSALAGKILVKLGCTEEEALAKIENCLAFETLIAPSIFTKDKQQSADYFSRIMNYYTKDEFSGLLGDLPLIGCLEKAGFPVDGQFCVMTPDYFERLRGLYTDENLPLIRDCLIVHGVIAAADRLDRECYEWNVECKNAISGSTGMLDDETAASTFAADTLEWPVAQLYTERYLSVEDKERVTEMVEEILLAYHEILEEAEFLSDETKEKAIEKLDAIKPRVLFPDSWEKYECVGLEFLSPEEGGTLWAAMRAIAKYSTEKAVREFGDPIDKDVWAATPQTVNCFYHPTYNSITILGAFAQGDIYNKDMSDEELYGKLGVVIGHEISHAFDRSGAQFDKDGNMTNWWTEEDYAAFTERNEKLAAYFDAMHPWEGQDFHGSIMTGEACADMAGMKTALVAVRDIEGFDYDAFFRAYADIWLTKATLPRELMLLTNTHPMQYLRVNATLQQYDEFLEYYGIEEGDGMFLAPEDRVNIW